MSRPIKMTQAYMDECRQDFEKALQLTKLADGKLTFTKTFSIADRKAVLYFTADAWAKMTALIRDFDKEVAWHGVASRGEDDGKDEYIISDIVVYPQTVSGATVEMDTEEYAKWLMDNADDERFEHIHMQGHSHVNMAPNPSSVDLNHQEEILNMLGDDDFYIFMIWNKSLSNNIKIYDLKKNVLFEDKDITFQHEEGELDEFIKQAKEMVKTAKETGKILTSTTVGIRNLPARLTILFLRQRQMIKRTPVRRKNRVLGLVLGGLAPILLVRVLSMMTMMTTTIDCMAADFVTN